MHERLSVSSAPFVEVSTLATMRRRGEARLFLLIFLVVLIVSPLLLLAGAKIGYSVVIALLAVLGFICALIRWPSLGLFVTAACVFLVEQEPLSTPIFTDTLYIFHWPKQLEGFIERPVGVLMLLALGIWLFHRLAQREKLLRGGSLIRQLGLFMVCVLGGSALGLATGGNLKIIVVEFRPFWYLFIAYIMTVNFITQKKHVRAFFWLVIICAGIKAFQGLYIYLVAFHGNLEGHDTIMSHEESFFFAALLLLVIVMSMCYRYRPQLIAALVLLPPVLISLVANNRRTDYVALLVGIGVSCVLVFLIRPEARKKLVTGVLICSVLGGAYVAAFSHSTGTLASPARAVLSVFSPSSTDVRDVTSNLYRIYEDNDLKYTVKQHPLGLGFGKPFLEPQPLTNIFPNIINFDPYYNYVPHNTIYWIWADLGPLGYFALWLLIGTIILYGCTWVRRLKDPYLQFVAIYIVAITFMEVIVAFADYQLFFYRNVIYLGLLCGMLVRLPALDSASSTPSTSLEQKEVPAHETAHDLPPSPPSLVGSRNA